MEKQGDGKEGQILLVFSFMPTPAGAIAPAIGPNMAFIPTGNIALAYPGGVPTSKKQPQVYQSNQPVTNVVQPPHPSPPRAPAFNPDDFKQLKEMFPNMDEDVIKSVYEAGGFHKDSAANALLSMIAD